MAPWGLAQGNTSVCIDGAGQGPKGTISQPLRRLLLEVEERTGLCNHPRGPTTPPEPL